MIAEWLDKPALDVFRTQIFDRQPYAQPNSAANAKGLFTEEKLDRILAAPPAPDALIVRNGAPLDEPVPRSMVAVKALFTAGKSVVIRKGERHDAGLANLAAQFANDFHGKTTIQLFVTPKAFHSFGWHYDVEDVFIVQTVGIKEYFMRQNTVNPRPTIRTMPKDLGYERETSKFASCTLEAGDWLYIPSGWWHVARCVEDSLSISIGVLSARAEGEKGKFNVKS